MNALHLIENCIDSTGDEVGRVLRQGSVAKEALVRSWDTEAQALRQLVLGCWSCDDGDFFFGLVLGIPT